MAARRLTVAAFHEETGWRLGEEALAPLRASAPEDMAIVVVRSHRELLETLPETTHLVGVSAAAQTLREHAPKLQWVQLLSASAESLTTLGPLLAAGVRVTSSQRARAPQAAEHALLLTLALCRRLSEAVDLQRAHTWATSRLAADVRDLFSSCVGVVHLGPVGATIARTMATLGCETLAVGAESLNEEDAASLAKVEKGPLRALDELLARSDVVIATPPLALRPGPTLDRAAFESMKASAFLVDVSRPHVVDESALFQALRKEKVAGAALDAVERAPLPADHPLWTMPTVLLTPSLAGVSPSFWQRAVTLAAENLRRVTQGQPLLDEVQAPAATAAPTG